MTPRTRRGDRWLAVAGVAGVAGYVGTWFTLGLLREGYDPTQQAISELFALDAPGSHRVALSTALAVTGALLVPFAGLLHRRLPGTSPVGPILLAYSGAMTVAVVAFPCTAGCPGAGSSFTDTMHVATAGSGYVGLVTAPIATGWRIRRELPALGRTSMALGLASLAGFVVRNTGLDINGGLQQRVFNTTADAWIALMGWHLLRTDRKRHAVAGTTGTGDGRLAGDR